MTGTDIRVRFAVLEDADAIAHGIRALAEYEGVEDQTMPSVEAIRHDLTHTPPDRLLYLIARIGPEIAGYAIAYPAYVPNVTAWYEHVRDLYVMPDFRKRGVGRALMYRVAELAKQWHCSGIQLEVMTRNVEAVWYYESLGFASDPGTSSLYLEGDAFESFLHQ